MIKPVALTNRKGGVILDNEVPGSQGAIPTNLVQTDLMGEGDGNKETAERTGT